MIESSFSVFCRRWLNGPRGVALGLMTLGMTLLAIWMPELLRYAVLAPVPTGDAVETMRVLPASELLDELFAQSLTGQPTLSTAELQGRADRLVEGWYEPHSLPAVQVGPDFRPEALDAESPTVAMLVAALAPVDILVRAYRIRGDVRYLNSAEAFVRGFAAEEQSRLLARGLLWNDHAIAARLNVLIGFWRAWRQTERGDVEVEQAVMSLVARGGAQRAKASLFTVPTNHGVMQNIALLQAALAFPLLPERERWLAVARERLDVQLPFYLGPEGIVLEHSAGYHQHGLTLVAAVLRLEHLAGMPVRSDLLRRYESGVAVLRQWRRPDGTLPSFGNTGTRPEPFQGLVDANLDHALQAQAEDAPSNSFGLYPVSGYGVVWSGLDHWPDSAELTQTSLVWSNFSGHGHKHADEMSLQLWADGREWIGNVGYWPYGAASYAEAVSWPGSNAPHAVGEAMASARITRLVAYGHAEGQSLFDLERSNGDRSVLRRQLVVLPGGLWLVLDSSVPGINTMVTRRQWTVGAGLDWHPSGQGFAAVAGGRRMALAFSGVPAPSDRLLRGSQQPFAGWLAVDGRVVPATALVIDQPAGGWLMTALQLGPDGAGRPLAVRVNFESPDRWQASLDGDLPTRVVRRVGDLLEVDGRTVLRLVPGPAVDEPRAEIATALRTAIERYPRTRDLIHYRQSLTGPVAVAGVMQEGVLFAVASRRRRLGEKLRLFSLLAWAALTAWLSLVYLV